VSSPGYCLLFHGCDKGAFAVYGPFHIVRIPPGQGVLAIADGESVGASPVQIELTRFRVKPDKTAQVDAWMTTLNQRIADVRATLDREEMLVEVIFRETIDGHEYLSWFSIQGENGQPVETSPHDLDRVHLEFWRDCIDRDFSPQDATPQVVMMPLAIADHLEQYLQTLRARSD